MTAVYPVLAAVAAYLLGSLSFAVIVTRVMGLSDPRTYGSKNPGATNVLRSGSKAAAIITLLLDAVKGFVPAFVFPRLMESAPPWLGLACGVAAVAGHNWPVWLGFKGGKGVSTSAGMLLGIAPAAVGIGFAVFAAVLALTRIVSLGSILAAIAVAGSGVWLYGADNRLLAGALVAMGALVVLKHRANVGRLLKGTEPRIVGKK